MQYFGPLKAQRIYQQSQSLFLLILFCSLVFFSEQTSAQGDLLIFPKRVVFEGDKKSQVITLSNLGKDTATYNISIVQIRMNEDGRFENILQPDPGQLFADTFLRFYPRTVTLAPNESQVVKIQLTKTNGLKPGEYRSHLYFRAVPKAVSPHKIQNDSSSISVRLTAIFGITIATIIRVGESNTNVTISNLSFEKLNDSIPVLHMEFDRTGNMSVYGDITVKYISPKGKATKVGEIQGFAVYTPNDKRICKMSLSSDVSIDYSSGELSVEYSTQPDAKSLLIAQQNLKLQPLLLNESAEKQH